jgi:hypothetical protein
MARFLQMVLTSPRPGQEDEFNHWYSEEHLSDVLGVDGIVAAQRFEFVASNGSADPQQRYLALYEVEADDHQEAIAKLNAALTEPGRMRRSNSLDPDFRQWYFRPLGERMVSED